MHDDTSDTDLKDRLKPLPFKRPVTPRPEQDALLPAQDNPYKAAGIADNNELPSLVLIMGKEGFKDGSTAYYSVQYVHLGLGEFGFTEDGQWFRFVVSDLQPKQITVRGRDLLRIFDYIRLRRLPWIREADRDLRNGEPIITQLDIDDWVPPEA
jgi:hypothetical protein